MGDKEGKASSTKNEPLLQKLCQEKFCPEKLCQAHLRQTLILANIPNPSIPCMP
jgi:hypothetical protein